MRGMEMTRRRHNLGSNEMKEKELVKTEFIGHKVNGRDFSIT